MDVTTPLVVDIDLYEEQVKDVDHIHQLRVSGDLKEKQIASKQLNRLYMKPGTKRIPLNIKEHGIHGTLFIPPGKGPFPGNFVFAIELTKQYVLSNKKVLLILNLHVYRSVKILSTRFISPFELRSLSRFII